MRLKSTPIILLFLIRVISKGLSPTCGLLASTYTYTMDWVCDNILERFASSRLSVDEISAYKIGKSSCFNVATDSDTSTNCTATSNFRPYLHHHKALHATSYVNFHQFELKLEFQPLPPFPFCRRIRKAFSPGLLRANVAFRDAARNGRHINEVYDRKLVPVTLTGHH
ncbi:hypothetical protein D9758_013055 [Tetrapyrgos nigripes]|uniref:Uncharacterized protein n=1 Tax=Tetrapyrgos nigripes TaxID=182062 RepID=A0A8H5FQQ4_9AGAR|nr:hypothetical protein D9758_013055 [Tetrapyrgos nigripes]